MPIVILVVLIVVVAVVVAVVRSRGGDEDAGTVDVEGRLTSTVQPVGLVGDPTAKKAAEPKPSLLPTMPAVSPADPDPADEPVVFEPDLSRFDGAGAERKPVELRWPDVAGPEPAPETVAAETSTQDPAAAETSEPMGSETSVPEEVPAGSALAAASSAGPSAVAGDPESESASSVDPAPTPEIEATTPGDPDAAVGDGSADPAEPTEDAHPHVSAEVSAVETDAVRPATGEAEAAEPEAAEPEAAEPEAAPAPEASVVADAEIEVSSEAQASTTDDATEAERADEPAADEVEAEQAEEVQVAAEADRPAGEQEPVVAAGESSGADDPTAGEQPAEGAAGQDDERAVEEDEVVIDLVETELAQLQPEPDPVDQVLNALINRARQRNVGVAEVAAELVEQAALEDREVDEVLADLVVRSEDEGDIHTSDRLTELTFFNDAVPRRPGELSQFERLGDTEKKRVIIRVLCLLVAQAEDSHMRPREPRSEAETRSWPLARAIWPVQTAEDPDDADLPARPVARSGR